MLKTTFQFFRNKFLYLVSFCLLSFATCVLCDLSFAVYQFWAMNQAVNTGFQEFGNAGLISPISLSDAVNLESTSSQLRVKIEARLQQFGFNLSIVQISLKNFKHQYEVVLKKEFYPIFGFFKGTTIVTKQIGHIRAKRVYYTSSDARAV